MTGKNGQVLILAHPEDPHLPCVTKFLHAEPVVINAGDVPEGKSITYHWDGSGNPWPRIICNGEVLPPIKSVWFRSLDMDKLRVTDVPVSDDLRPYALSALNRLAGGLAELIPDALWMSPPHALKRADLKPYQLMVARRVGFDVPRTLITSDAEHALAFLRELGECVVKPLATQPPQGYNQFTQRFQYVPDISMDGLHLTPHILQQIIEPDFELRIAVVGTEVHASKVEDINAADAEKQGIRDFRRSFVNETFRAEPFSLPVEVTRRCILMLRELGLYSGKFDFIVRNGVYYFLELNANGQWAFVDDETVERIGRSYANLLEAGVPPW